MRGVLITLFALSAVWLVVAAIASPTIVRYATQELYDDPIVFEKQTRYQQITLTSGRLRSHNGFDSDVRLFSNGGLQFSSIDEYRYHEALVHPVVYVALRGRVRDFDALVLGGGDGLAVRELRKHVACRSITVVDLDEEVTSFFSADCTSLPEGSERDACTKVTRLNEYSFSDPRVSIVNRDAFSFLRDPEEENHRYDVIIIDLPDPYSIQINKLYTREFFRLVRRAVRPGGAMVVQSTSPFHARDAFLCIHKTLEAADFTVVPYWVNVPTFGEWGFNLGVLPEQFTEQSLEGFMESIDVDVATRWLNQPALQGALRFGKDAWIGLDRVAINTLIEPKLLQYYRDGWEDE